MLRAERAFRRAYPDRERMLLVHQMGRVGSRSLERALVRHLPDTTVFHLHFLSGASIERTERRLRRQHRVTGRVEIPLQLVAARHLRDRLRKARDRDRGRPWKVVSLVRDPLARHVSAFFQFFPTFFPRLPDDYHCDPAHVGALADLLAGRFGDDRAHMAGWFDTEVRDTLGVDVFSAPFPRERGYQIVEGDRAHLLVLRLEDLERVAPTALKEFLGIEGITVPRLNVASRKPHGGAYRAFVQRAPLPAKLLDEVYGSRLARHFYSDDEIAAFRAKWGAEDEAQGGVRWSKPRRSSQSWSSLAPQPRPGAE